MYTRLKVCDLAGILVVRISVPSTAKKTTYNGILTGKQISREPGQGKIMKKYDLHESSPHGYESVRMLEDIRSLNDSINEYFALDKLKSRKHKLKDKKWSTFQIACTSVLLRF